VRAAPARYPLQRTVTARLPGVGGSQAEVRAIGFALARAVQDCRANDTLHGTLRAVWSAIQRLNNARGSACLLLVPYVRTK